MCPIRPQVPASDTPGILIIGRPRLSGGRHGPAGQRALPPDRGDEGHARPVDQVGVGRRVENHSVGARTGPQRADVLAPQGVRAAERAIDSGAAADALERFVQRTNELAGT